MEHAVKMLQKFFGKSKRILQADINLFGIVLSHVCYSDTLALQLRSITLLNSCLGQETTDCSGIWCYLSFGFTEWPPELKVQAFN